MSSSSCICVDKTSPRSSWDYPEYREGDSDETLLQTFQKNGYFVVRGLITQQEISQSLEAISDIVKRWFAKLKDGGEEGNDWDEVANRLPELQGQAIGDDDLANELTIRRLFRMAIHEQYFTEFCRHPKIVSMITKLLGPDIKLLQSMSLLKPPGSGQKTWHQDNAYFRLTPAVVTGVWIALDPTDCSNGCMHILPSSHGTGIYPHAAPAMTHTDYSLVTLPQPNDVVPIVLDPGDALVFHGEIAHYTPANVSSTRRRALQFHYASSHCKPTKCPRTNGESHTDPTLPPPDQDKPHYFDCDSKCVEPLYWYFRKAEILVNGRDMGGDYI